MALTLFELFDDFRARFPVSRVQPFVGLSVTEPEVTAWLGQLNNGVDVTAVHPGAFADHVTVAAKLQLDIARTGFVLEGGFPFVLTAMPDVEFRIQEIKGSKFVDLFAAVSDQGVELILEGLPVEIRLPPELVEPAADVANDPVGSGLAEKTVGKFTAGTLDTLEIRYRRGGPTSIYVHIRLHMDIEGRFAVRPAVPISFGPCKLMGLPCLAVHDFQLIPSPARAPFDIEWLRHRVTAWSPELQGDIDGCWSARSVHFDSRHAPLKSLAESLNNAQEQDATEDTSTTINTTYGQHPFPKAEFVLDDLVMPFYALYVLPLPRHVTIGLRRTFLDPSSAEELFRFKNAPVYAYLSRGQNVAFILESLFYRSKVISADDPDPGISFAAGIAFGQGESDEPDMDQQAILLELAEQFTVRATYKRKFNSTTGDPEPESTWSQFLNGLLHWEIATIEIDIMAVRSGYAIGRAVAEDADFGDCFEFTVDLYISMPPTGGDDSFFKLRALNGEKVKFAVEALGWRQGSFHADLALPDGVIILFGPFGIILEEIGLLQEGQATYLSFSGGFMWNPPAGMSGGLTFKRLRFRVAGSEDEPFFKLNGLFAFLRGAVFHLEAGGYYRDETLPDQSRVQEYGLTGTLALELKVIKFRVSLDVLIGDVSHPVQDDFDYFMFQFYFRGVIPIYGMELRTIRFLLTDNMNPKLAPPDPDSRELRYFNWYRGSNPLNVTGDRRLAAWQALDRSQSIGIGFGASIAGLSKVVEFNYFVLGVHSPTENGILIVFEVLVMESEKAVGYGVLEWDMANDRFSLLVGVDVTIRNFINEAPAWMDNVGKLSGTLFISNEPGTFAIGRLADQKTWLTLKFEWDFILRAEVAFGLCVEIVDGGPKGVGFYARVGGGINAGIIKISYHAAFGFVIIIFTSGSNDYAVAVNIEAGFRIVLFGFLRFGISASIDFRHVGSRPASGELSLTLRLETPWFLPDVTWKASATFGEVEPAEYAALTAPLQKAALTEGVTERTLPPHVERVDNTWDGEGAARTFSVATLRTIGDARSTRVARFEANAEVIPVATDATLSIIFNVPVNDLINLDDRIVANGLGNQASGELSASYELIGLTIRRRPRFDAAAPWTLLQERIELTADFSDPDGVTLSGSFGPQVLQTMWDIDVKVAGQPAPKKLLINSSTPFEYITENQAGDEAVVAADPTYPCCPSRDKPTFTTYFVHFREELPGTVVDSRLFSDDRSRFRFHQTARARLRNLGVDLPVDAIVAALNALPGRLFAAAFDQPAAFAFVRLAWRGVETAYELHLVGYDAVGTVVASRRIPISGLSDFLTHTLPAQGQMVRLEAWLVAVEDPFEPDGQRPFNPQPLELDEVRFIPLADYIDELVAGEGCAGSGDPDHQTAYEGRGKVSFLPNYQYEVAVRTRLRVDHPSEDAAEVEVEEYAYFATKGLPGLNEVERLGAEIEPYVQTTYTGGRGVLYREEPVVLVFSEDFYTAVPLALRPPGSAEEETTLLQMQLVVAPNAAPTKETVFTTTDEDWIVANRAIFVEPLGPIIWHPVLANGITLGTGIPSQSLYRARLALLTQRPAVPCDLADPREVVGTALIAFPQGTTDPDDPTRELWRAGAGFLASVRAKGAPFVDRSQFIPADLTALTRLNDNGGGDAGAWQVSDGRLIAAGGAARRFALLGETEWDHVTVNVGIALTGAAAGIGVALPGSAVDRGLFAVVRRSGSNLQLAILRRRSGTQLQQLGVQDLPASVDASAVPLVVTAYDDRLQVAVGETLLSVDREELRAGRLALYAEGGAAFTSLSVHGLDMYEFPFAVGRFISFADHIHSFRGVVDGLAPDSLGPGTTTGDASTLWNTTATEVAAVMDPAAEPVGRQALFSRWLDTLGLPLKDEVTRLELSQYVAGGQAQLLLLESPEPLDFTAEVRLRLTRRTLVREPATPTSPGGNGRGSILERLRRRRLVAEPASRLADLRAARDRRARLRRDLFNSLGVPGFRTPGGDGDDAGERLLIDVTREDDNLLIVLNTAALGDGDREVRLAVLDRPDPLAGTVDLFPIRIRESGGRRGARLEIKLRRSTAEKRAIDALEPAVRKEVRRMERGHVFLLDEGLNSILDRFIVRIVFVDVSTAVLTDATGHRALIIPLDGTAHQPQPTGQYRLHFSLDRARWTTDDPPDSVNRYQDEATLTLTL